MGISNAAVRAALSLKTQRQFAKTFMIRKISRGGDMQTTRQWVPLFIFTLIFMFVAVEVFARCGGRRTRCIKRAPDYVFLPDKYRNSYDRPVKLDKTANRMLQALRKCPAMSRQGRKSWKHFMIGTARSIYSRMCRESTIIQSALWNRPITTRYGHRHMKITRKSPFRMASIRCATRSPWINWRRT